MKNKKYILLSIILIIFIINSDIVINSVLKATNLFYNKVFVSIFPFIILSDILIYNNYHIFLGNNVGKILSKVFNINKSSSIAIIMSLLTSQPSNSIYISNLLDNNIIDEDEANYLLLFTYFPSISFVIGTIGIALYNNIYIGVILLLLNYIFNFILGIIFKRKYNLNNITLENKKEINFFAMLKESIIKSINTCFIILGNIIIFLILINIINHYINTNEVIMSLYSGIIELTNGINIVSLINIPLKYKVIITSFLLNFSSLSILFQSSSILYKYNINIKKILIIKLIFSIIFSTILLICCCGI